MPNKYKEYLRKFLMVVAVIAILFSGYQLLQIKEEKDTSKTINKEVVEIIGKEEDGSVGFLTKKSFQELYAINNDFKGYIYYPSLQINEQVVQGSNNDYYLDHTFYGDYLSLGTVFVEASQDMDEQNTTLYGHGTTVSTLKFSNLHKLKKASDYDKYKTFYFVDKDFIYEFEVGVVLYAHSIDDYYSIPYWMGSFSESEFSSFISNAKAKQFYDTGVNFNADDNIISLQTCLNATDERRLVVIAKEVSRQPLKDQ
ncbi:MAG: class B sortase [Erysipelothrix sp.]|nr:class B sortase [Erysipelothrix sp.]